MNDSSSIEKLIQGLGCIGSLGDADISLGNTALLFSAMLHPGILIERYDNHLAKLGKEVGERYKALIDAGSTDDAELRLASLKHILSDKYDYKISDAETLDIIDIDFIQVIDNRRGAGTVTAFLYVDAGRRQGWDISILNIPGCSMLVIEHQGRRIIFDPADNCKIMQAPDLRRAVKEILGEDVELSSQYYEPSLNRDVLLWWANRIKYIQVSLEDYEAALLSTLAMKAIAPGDHRLLFDEGILSARLDKLTEAETALEGYIDQAPYDQDRHDAAILLQDVRSRME